jgi:hypothetical protein
MIHSIDYRPTVDQRDLGNQQIGQLQFDNYPNTAGLLSTIYNYWNWWYDYPWDSWNKQNTLSYTDTLATYIIIDTDKDQLLDGEEAKDANLNNPSLPQGAADALKKDIFVEADYMPGHILTSGAIANLVNVYSSYNIVIHIINDDQIEHTDTLTGTLWNNLYSSGSESWGFTPTRRGIYHYGIMAHRNAANSGTVFGEGYVGGDSFALYDDLLGSDLLPPWVSHETKQTHIFMHELGHNILGQLDESHRYPAGDTDHCGNDCVMYYKVAEIGAPWRAHYCSACLNEISRDGLLGL